MRRLSRNEGKVKQGPSIQSLRATLGFSLCVLGTKGSRPRIWAGKYSMTNLGPAVHSGSLCGDGNRKKSKEETRRPIRS